jgi:hypothetical protein
MQFASTREHRSSVQRSLIDAWVVVIHTQAKKRTEVIIVISLVVNFDNLYSVQSVPGESRANENETTFLEKAELFLLKLKNWRFKIMRILFIVKYRYNK